jgi:two-component system phosphate regulon sensor histidine kinase PhoR
MFRNLRWRIVFPYVALILVAMAALSFYLTRVVRQSALDDLQEHLLVGTRTVAEAARPLLAGEIEAAASEDLASRWAELLEARVTIIGPGGEVLGESDVDPASMENHLRRPEIQEAQVTGVGTAIRFSETLEQEMMYTALPVTTAGETLGYVRVALPLNSVESSINQLRGAIITGTLLSALFTIGLAIVIAERIARPVRRLTGVARRMAEGDLDVRLLTNSQDEIGTLTRAFNYMGEQLRDKVSTLAEERGRLATVLELMADGVLITDGRGRVELINPAAARLLDTTEEDALGRSFAQVVHHHQLIELEQRCRETGEEQSETVEIAPRNLFLQVVITPLPGQQGHLVIIQNLTAIRHLQTVRRDFISNISHELRTPLASLKAVIETLRDGALDDPPAAQRFLDRGDREVDALTQMVQELLELSRIESGKVPLRLSPTKVADIIMPPVERLRPQAERNQLTLTLDIPDDLPLILVDSQRVQQVVSNLLHNAIKFTPAGGEVVIRATTGPRRETVTVSVADTGVGIPDSDLPRIFERFYKADRARSSGGTGLGLAIARHLVQAHAGQIEARSREGQGSVFSFTLPTA